MENKSSLTSLRFFAAFLVVGSHYFNFYPSFSYLGEIFKKGYLGVEFFFVLSGFVMALRYTQEIEHNRFNAKRFISFRFIRIIPAYYLSLLLSVPLLIRALPQSEFLSSSKNFALFVLANLSFLQSYIPTKSMIDHWNLPSWSLSVEMFFYFMFPFISVKLIKKNNPTNWLITLFSICIVSYIIHLILPEQITFLGTQTGILWINNPILSLGQFLLGNVLYLMYRTYKSRESDKLKFYLFMIFSLAFLVIPLPSFVIGNGNPFSLFAFSGLIFYSAVCDNGKGILNNTLLVELGKASYALYILQVPLKVLFQQIYSKLFHIQETMGFLYCTYLSLTLIMSSYFIYRYFELPIDKYLRGRIK